MTYFGKFFSNFRDFYNEINASTLTGAIDVIVVEQPDGSFTCSPFHVRFGKLGVLRSREKVVDIEINGTPLDLHMKLGESGEAFFVEKVSQGELGDDELIPAHLACSPIPGDEDSYESFEKSFIAVKEQEKEAIEEIFKSDGNDSTPTHVEDSFGEGPSESTVMNSEDLQSEIGLGDMDGDSQIQPKTFRAETSETKVSEIVRKVTSVTGEFRPIDMEPPVSKDEESLEGTKMSKDEESLEGTKMSKDEVSVEGTNITPLESSESQLPKDKKLDDTKDSNNSPFIDNETSSETYETTTESIKEPVVVDKRRRRKKSFLKKKSEMRSKKTQDNVPNGVLKETNKTSSTSRSKENLLKAEDKVKERRSFGEFSKSESDAEERRTRSGFPESESGALTDPEQNHGSSSDVESARDLNSRKRSSIDPDFHFFSDTEATPGYNSQREHRCTPVQSDSEVDKQVHEIEEGRSWRWGELPTPPQLKVSVTEEVGDMAISRLSIPEDVSAKEGSTEAQRSMLTSMFSFMRRKHLRQHPTNEGIYLSDINPEDLDPEVAALYFPRSYHQGFTEPGRHLHEVEHITKSDDDQLLHKDDHPDNESGCGVSLPQSPTSDSGKSEGGKGVGGGDPRLDVLKDIAMSLCGGLEDGGPKESVFLQKLVLYEDFVQDPKVINDPNLVVRFNGKYYNWKTACPLVMSVVSYRKPLPQSAVELLSTEYMPQVKAKEEKPVEARRSSWWSYSWRRVEPKQKEEEVVGVKEETPTSEEAPKEEKTEASGSIEIETEVSQLTSISEDITDTEMRSGRYRKTLRLSSEQIAGLRLLPGQNEAEFTVTSAYQGTSRCRCHIYRWRWDDKIVISDIDGTITKSDVLGHILPIVGKDWAQSGVAQLFTKIMNNGYKVVYLSARAIGQARSTRDYLRSIKQEDLCLPDGPLLLSPTGLLSALHREVIEKKPEEFKISCLRDIEALFPPGSKPFYAGYGNKVNDVWAYRAVGIPMFRIFTINHRGELRHECSQTFQSSYSNMSYLVDQMFPPANTATSAADYSNFVYWREPIQDVVVDDLPDDAAKAN